MVTRLVAGILALVFLLLGIPFLILGFALDGEDADGFRASGAITLVVGLLAAGVFLVLQRGAAAERRRRQGRASAEIVEARLHPYTRIGVLLTYTVTIRYTHGARDRTFTRKLLVPPTVPLNAGEQVEVRYDPEDPGNFELAAAGAEVASRGRSALRQSRVP